MLTGLALSSPRGGVEAFDFTFSKGALRPNEIFDSATSPPSRYLLEVGRRIAKAAPTAQVLAIANPLLPLRGQQVLGWLQEGVSCPAVISDEGGFPLVYVLPRRMFEGMERFLLLLSAVDANLDIALLAKVLGCDISWTRLPNLQIGAYPLSTPTGWFQGTERQKILKVITATAVKTMEGNSRWRDLPFSVYHPYHAGSVVFFSVASQHVTTPLFQRHIVCASYKDIVEACDSRLEPIWLDQPWLPRDNSIGEPQYFCTSLEKLGAEVVRENFIVFMRYSRNTGQGPFHRIDQDRFSLGESLDGPDATLQTRLPTRLGKCELAPAPLKVLFHIAGGLPIKTYPFEDAKIVLRSLRSLNIEVTVIDRPDLAQFGATSIVADNTALLSEAVRRHHIFVGLDSFPHHFVRNAMGWPTVGLFGATAAANFGGGWNDHYRSLDASLPCHPCNSDRECPVFRTKECVNYPQPRQLVTAILEMAERVYGFRA